jgi:hypothetical protein
MPYSKQQLALRLNSALGPHDKALLEWASKHKQREKQLQMVMNALPANADTEQRLAAYGYLRQIWFEEFRQDLMLQSIKQDAEKFLPRLREESERDQPMSCLWLRLKSKLPQHKQQQEAPQTSTASLQTPRHDTQCPPRVSAISPSTEKQQESHTNDKTNPSTSQGPCSTPQQQQEPSTQRMQDKKGQLQPGPVQQQQEPLPRLSGWIRSVFSRHRGQAPSCQHST